jgi:glycosyltransferase involved in cell wall biosynthesis
VNSSEKLAATYSEIGSKSEHQDPLVATQTSTLTGFTECRTFTPLVPKELGESSEIANQPLPGTERMRIGLITADFHPNVGGVAAHVVELGKALTLNGHEVHVVTLPLGDQRDRSSELHGMVVHRPLIPKGKPLYSWLTRMWLNRFLATTPLDVMHVHGLRPLEATSGLTMPVVFTNHTSGFLKRIQKGEFERARLAKRLAHVAHVLAPSDELVEATKSVGYDGPVHFIPNGVDTGRFQPGDLQCQTDPTVAQSAVQHRAEWTRSDDEVVVLLARRLVEKNGVTVFAEAVTRLEHRERVRVVFAGDGAERSQVERILREGNMLDRSVFLGNVPNQAMPGIYRAADLSVLPSFMEATSITGLESMATGLPLIGTRVGGIPAIIKDGQSGLLVPPGEPGEIAAAIDRLVSDEALRKAMGVAGRQSAVAGFSWAGIAERTAEIYRQYLRSAA